MATAAHIRIVAATKPKLANALLYLLQRCAFPPGKQALLKMVWYADYWHYQQHLSFITEAEYVAMPNGPVIDNYQRVLDEFVQQGVLSVERKQVYNRPNPKEEYQPLVEADNALFTASELMTLNRVIAECAGRSGTDLSLRTHREGPWIIAYDEARPNQPIPRMLFRWADNMLDEDGQDRASAALAREHTQRDLAALLG